MTLVGYESFDPGLLSVMDWLFVGLAVISFVALLAFYRHDSPHGRGRDNRNWMLFALTAGLSVGAIIFATAEDIAERNYEDEHYPQIILEAGYTYVLETDGDDYVAVREDGQPVVVVEVIPVENVDDQFIVQEVQR